MDFFLLLALNIINGIGIFAIALLFISWAEWICEKIRRKEE